MNRAERKEGGSWVVEQEGVKMGLGESGKREKLKQGCRGVKWNENREEEERRFLWEAAARGVIRED